MVTLLLALSTAYLQSSVFAFATLRGSTEMLAVMSGQVGIAVLVSGAQMILAVISAIRSTSVGGDTEQSTLAGVGLWALGSAGAFACMIAHQYLFRHPEYSIVLAPILSRANIDSDDEEQHVRGVTTRVFWQNIQLEAAVAWVFVVTLVSGKAF